MNCPKCLIDENVLEVHVDTVTCDCGATINIRHLFCEKCGYYFKTYNNSVLEEYDLGAFPGLCLSDLADYLDGEFLEPQEFLEENQSMLDFINPCVKCGSASTIFDGKANTYECSACGFKWETLKNE